MKPKVKLVSLSLEISFDKKQSRRILLGVTIREIASDIADRFIEKVSLLSPAESDLIGDQTQPTITGEFGSIDVTICKNGKPKFNCSWRDMEHSCEYLSNKVLATLYEIIPNWNK